MCSKRTIAYRYLSARLDVRLDISLNSALKIIPSLTNCLPRTTLSQLSDLFSVYRFQITRYCKRRVAITSQAFRAMHSGRPLNSRDGFGTIPKPYIDERSIWPPSTTFNIETPLCIVEGCSFMSDVRLASQTCLQQDRPPAHSMAQKIPSIFLANRWHKPWITG